MKPRDRHPKPNSKPSGHADTFPHHGRVPKRGQTQTKPKRRRYGDTRPDKYGFY